MSPWLINSNCQKKCNFKTGGPPRLINILAYPRLINHQFWNPFFIKHFFNFQSYLFPIVCDILLIIIVILQVWVDHWFFLNKNTYSPNDRFLIKIFIKIISLDSSQRVPPMSPCPPLIITRVCPWLINHLSDPWNFNKSNGILLRSNGLKPYPKFYGSELLIIKGSSRKLARRYPPYLPGGVINPVLALLYIYIDIYIYILHIRFQRNAASGKNRATGLEP